MNWFTPPTTSNLSAHESCRAAKAWWLEGFPDARKKAPHRQGPGIPCHKAEGKEIGFYVRPISARIEQNGFAE